MGNTRPPQIAASHLARKAVVYIRQSSEKQVLHNEGSTAFQRDQVRFPKLWGWPAGAIELIDEDLGLSGSTTIARSGYRRMAAEVAEGLIGAIFVADFSRAGRKTRDWLDLIEGCQLHNVLVVVDGKIYDLRDSRERFLSHLIAAFGEHENDMRRETLQRARLAKARTGKAVSAPPCGYVRLPDGSWAFDPDPTVQAAIRTVFRVFCEQRSLRQCVRELRALGVQLPRRDRRFGVRWVRPQIETLAVLLKHPAYKGEYVYRRRVSDPARGRNQRGRVPLRRAANDEQIIVHEHHVPYVSRDVWDEVQAILAAHAPSQERRNPGPGSGLLQGIVRCARHRGYAMSTVYKAPRRDGGHTHAYQCGGEVAVGGKLCGRISGLPLDRAVVEACLVRLTPPAVVAVREAWSLQQGAERAELHRREIGLHRARAREADVRNRFFNVDPGNRLVAAALEREWEVAQQDVERLARLLQQDAQERTYFDDAAFEELTTLCADVDAVWHAPTTTNMDRKELLRTMIDSVRIEERTPESIRAVIEWADCSPPRLLDISLARRAHRQIEELADGGVTLDEIVRVLNHDGILTLKGRPWTRHALREVLKRAEQRKCRPAVSPASSCTAFRSSLRRREGELGLGDMHAR